MSSDLRAGVLGVGRGLSFVRVMQAMDGVNVTAVADMHSERVKTVCAEHNVPKGFATLEEMLAEDLGPRGGSNTDSPARRAFNTGARGGCERAL